MTRRALLRWVIVSILVYVFYGALLAWFKFVDRFDELYVPLKDGAIFVSAVPAAWLTACFQRRTSFLEQLRDLWSRRMARITGRSDDMLIVRGVNLFPARSRNRS